MNKRIIISASIFGMIAVVLGAFGAHTLKERLSPAELGVWKTAVDYHFYHTFALLFLSTLPKKSSQAVNLSAWCFTIGILLFSGSLYLISLKNLLNLDQIAIIGPITPIGGLFFILGWISLLIATLKDK
jgi:uncharacterized membrane protein YgdD (TMEM256/DUF423 family)